MTEYWVSQSKYHCSVCNCFMADNKLSRQHHENSTRHKINVDKLAKKKKDEKLHGARSERELQQTLQEIETAAREAMGSNTKLRPPPPPPRTNFDTKTTAPVPLEQPDSAGFPEEENSGIYTIRGKTYLDGKVFEDKLIMGRQCEIFVEELDEWCEGEIIKRKEIVIPNTNLSLKTFEVSYRITSPDGLEEMVQESGIRSDRLRLIAAEDEDLATSKNTAEEPPSSVFQRQPVDENTGVSMWQTVSVKVVDEVQEYEEHQKAVEDMFSSAAKNEIEIPSGATRAPDEEEYIPRTYKGVVIEDKPQEMHFNHFEEEEGQSNVTFKKRKLNTEPSLGEGGDNQDTSKPLFKPAKAKNYRKK